METCMARSIEVFRFSFGTLLVVKFQQKSCYSSAFHFLNNFVNISYYNILLSDPDVTIRFVFDCFLLSKNYE